MQGLSRQKQCAFEFRRPIILNEFEIVVLIRSINFVADNGVTERRKVNANLMRATGLWNRAHDCKTIAGANESVGDHKSCDSRRAVRMNCLF